MRMCNENLVERAAEQDENDQSNKTKQILMFGETQRKNYCSVLRWNRKSRSANYMRNFIMSCHVMISPILSLCFLKISILERDFQNLRFHWRKTPPGGQNAEKTTNMFSKISTYLPTGLNVTHLLLDLLSHCSAVM